MTTVCVIIIMKKLHRGVAQMVARMVRDHEAASSSLATPTKKNPVISMVTGFFVFFGAARLASGSTKKVNKFGFFDKKTAQRQSLSGNFFYFLAVLRERQFIRSSSAVHPQLLQAVFKRHLSEKLGQFFDRVNRKVCCQDRNKFPLSNPLAARKTEHERPSPLGLESAV